MSLWFVVWENNKGRKLTRKVNADSRDKAISKTRNKVPRNYNRLILAKKKSNILGSSSLGKEINKRFNEGI